MPIIIVNCAFCGKELRKPASHLKQSKTGNLYCNNSCANSKNNSLFKSGANHPNYTNGKGSYRNMKLRIDEKKCESCGIEDIRVLEVHHIDGNRKNNALTNLKTVCANCHKIEHYKE